MKINVISDLHLEFGGFFEPTDKADVIVLAGDIGVGHKPKTYYSFIKECSLAAKHVIMVMGNHEHYHGNIDYTEDEILQNTAFIKNFSLLENTFIDIDGVRFIGSTFWSMIDPVHESAIHSGMNDYDIIYKGTGYRGSNNIEYDHRKLTTTDTIILHEKSSKYIFDAINIARNNVDKIFVVTHHNPTMRVAKQYRGNFLNSAYGTDYEEEIDFLQPDAWVFGHTHESFDFNIGKTRLICNPRGYYGYATNPYFDKDLIIEI